ncbi:MAG: hypothetical protein NPIRA06_23140 [Nitrospirales bacterium]|nr:MAG: hypothetical protein NPIRA06_23140 [Nitrospirales bacterium]
MSDLPARLRGETIQRVDLKPVHRRQGTPLASVFILPIHEYHTVISLRIKQTFG